MSATLPEIIDALGVSVEAWAVEAGVMLGGIGFDDPVTAAVLRLCLRAQREIDAEIADKWGEPKIRDSILANPLPGEATDAG